MKKIKYVTQTHMMIKFLALVMPMGAITHRELETLSMSL